MREFVYILILLFAATGAFAQSPVTADISSQQVAVNEIFSITINANGSDVKEPDMQAVADAGFLLGNPRQQFSTNMRSINGRTTVVQSRTWSYGISIGKEGTFTIPRISVTVDGKEYFTQPLTITVSNKIDLGSRSSDAADTTIDDLAFVRAITNKTVVYQGEPILLRLRLYMLDQFYVSVETSRTLPMPETEGFYSNQQWKQNLTEQYQGRTYRITEINQVLYPAMPGDLTIGAWQWQGRVNWLDGRRRQQTTARMFNTNPIKISVQPLPPQPPDFSGAVGKFSMQAHLSEDKLMQGKPVRLIVTISGEGNPNTIGTPEMPELSWAHISDPETETRQQDDNINITKMFSYLVTPLEAGEQVIPPVEFTFFAPILKNYKTDRSNEIKVTVQPSSESDKFVAIGGSAEEERRRIDVFDDDMLPIITDEQAIAMQMKKSSDRLGFMTLASPLLWALILVITYIALQQRRRLSQDHGYARRYYAKTACLKVLTEATRTEDPTETLYRAITTFVGDMLNINGAGLTSSEIEALLQERNVNDEVVSAVSRTMKACERARYAGRSSTPEEIEALCSAARDIVEQLHELLKEQNK